MRIEVKSLHGQALAQPVAAEFTELGGSIGRSNDNTLVLADEKKYISRKQAAINCRSGSFFLRDQGSATPTLVNGVAVGNGNEVALCNGDEIQISDYTLSVTIVSRPDALIADPFADLLAPAQAQETPAPALRSNPQLSVPADPFASLHEPGSRSANAAGQSSVIPSDFDPFADLTPTPPSAKPAMGDDFDLTSSPQNVDEVFGLKTPSWDPFSPEDPLLGAARSPSLTTSADPLGGPGQSSSPKVPASPQRDDAPILSAAFRPPQTKRAASPQAAPVAPEGSTLQNDAAASHDMLLSWETSSSAGAVNEIKTLILPSPQARAPAEPTRHQLHVTPLQAASVQQGATGAPAITSAAVPPQRDDLLRAFFAGCGVSDLRLQGGLTPEMMNLLGQLLRESIRGTLELLLARALTKREVRAEATVIVARENNPLKFSPTVEAALNHLLAPQAQGFLAPVEAVKDAYNDLRSHQFGIMAGMRAALSGVLTRFNPAQLEKRLATPGVMGSLLASSRKAKLWEQYEKLYSEILREAEDDFQALFGREFLKAYEAQIAKLERQTESEG